jgi:hypothetical protein
MSRGIEDLRRAATYYRDTAAVDAAKRAAAYRQRAAAAPLVERHGPCPAYPDGWFSHPRGNLLAAARGADAAARAFLAMAARIDARLELLQKEQDQ